MSPRTEEQLNELRDERKMHICNVALQLFAERGYLATSVSQIAKTAEISKGLMYNYFKSKEELLLKILELGMEEMFEVFDPNYEGDLTKEEIRLFINETFRMLKENMHYWKLYFSLFTQPSVYEIVKKHMGDIHTLMAKLLESYFAKIGSKDPFVDAIIFGALLDGVSFQYILEPDSFPIDRVQARILDMYCN